MSLYPILGHPLLRCPAGVGPTVLEAHARVAERVLGLVGTEYEGDDADEASDAVALQVNRQLAYGEGPPLKSETHGIETWVYTDQSAVTIDPLAAEIVAALADEAAEETPEGLYAPCVSLR